MINDKPGIIDRMFNVQNTVCLVLLIAFASGAGWALRQLAGAVDVPAYLLICGAIFAALLIFGAAFDARHRRP